MSKVYFPKYFPKYAITCLAGFLRCPDVRKKRIPGTSYTPKIDCSNFRKSGIMTTRLPEKGLLACPIDSDKAWGMLFESEAWKGSGQASDSNSIPHALFESSGMQIFPYPAIGYPNIQKKRISENPNSGESHLPAQWPNVLLGLL